MSAKKGIVLQPDRFHDNEDLEFRVPSKKELLHILQQIAEQSTRVALYYGDKHNFILTTLLGANNNGMWLDIGPFAPENKNILLSDKITFVSIHQHVKVQFTSDTIQSVVLDGHEVFFMPLPSHILRIQRRNHFRLSIPLSTPIKCTITIRYEDPEQADALPRLRKMGVLDISGGGIGLLCNEDDPDMVRGSFFEDCMITLSDATEIKVTLKVCGTFKFTMHNDVVKVCAGCQFISIDNQANVLLQRYITRLQAETIVKQ